MNGIQQLLPDPFALLCARANSSIMDQMNVEAVPQLQATIAFQHGTNLGSI